MSNPKKPNEFDDIDDAEATIMAPNLGQSLQIPGPPPGMTPTPPPMSVPPLTPPPASYNPPGHQTGGFTPHGAPPPPSAPPATSGPFVQQSVPSSPLPPSEERTRMLGEDGDDISSEATMVVGSIDSQLMIPLAKLVILEGIQKGKEYPLLGKEVSFGREKDNTISYPDLSVSRHHFKIHCSKDKFQLEDLGSGNGTGLNSKKVTGTVPIKHGDQIRVGKSILQFVIIGKEAKLGSSSSSSSSTGLIIGLLALLILGGGGVFFYMNQQKAINSNNNKKDFKQEQIRAAIKRGIRLRQKSKFTDAMLAFKSALQLSPGNLEAKQLLEDTKADINTSHFLRKAKFIVGQAQDAKKKENKIKNYKQAKTSLQKLEASMAPGSTYAPKVWALLTKVNRALNDLEGEDAPPKPTKPAEIEWGFKSYRKCRRKCRGRRKRCRRFRRRINGKRIRRYLCVKRGEKPPKPIAPPVQKRRRPASNNKVAKAERLYQSGDLQASARLFGAAGDKSRQQNVLRFAKLFYKSLADYRSYNPSRAIPSLTKALKQDYIIGEGKKSVYTNQLKKMLANMHFSKGLLLMNKQSYASAFRSFRKAIRYYKKHPNSLQKIKELRNRAKQWLQRGKSMQSSNPEQAKQFFRKVRRITLRTDSIRQEAEKLLR